MSGYEQPEPGILKLSTGITGLDVITEGGLPRGRTTLISGTSGSAKTVAACQFLYEGIVGAGENGVLITFEESAADLRKNMMGFGWDIQKLENEGKWVFVDASPRFGRDTVFAGEYDLAALLSRIEYAVKKVDARRVAIDPISGIFVQLHDHTVIRHELLKISSALKEMGVTALITSERLSEYGEISRFGIEEFVSDNVILLRNVLEEGKRRRTIEILKFRGAPHQKGEFPFTVNSEGGIVVIPISEIELKQSSSDVRISSGIPQLDTMCGGGFYRDSILLVSGATGTGKTLMVTHFLAGGSSNNERCLIFGFEESRQQLFRNAKGWGMDFDGLEHEGLLKVVCEYPEVTSLEDHLIRMKNTIEEFKPNRVAVDSLSALERVSTMKGFREFVIGLTSFIKHKETAGLFTSTTPTLMGGSSVTEAHISTITDTIILLRYVEMFGEMRRALTVLKMRGAGHNKEIREFSIDAGGMHIGKAFRNVTGILAGLPAYSENQEVERLDQMFK
jgi:circadian clock protein KaiC